MRSRISATSVLIGYVRKQIDDSCGAGGVMLPNHSPLIIAEQFGTLESLYPGRIDLGLDRAPVAEVPGRFAATLGTAAASFP